MIVGIARVTLHVHGSQSLKQKRGVVRSVVRRVRNRFNVAVAEVDGQDRWQRAVLGIAGVGAHDADVRAVLERVLDFVEDLHLAELVDSEVELVGLSGGDGHWEPDDGPDVRSAAGAWTTGDPEE